MEGAGCNPTPAPIGGTVAAERPEEILLCAEWARHNKAEGEDVLVLMCLKIMHNRLDQALKNKDFWEGQAVQCEKQITKLEKKR